MPVVANHAGRLSGVVNSAQPAWIASWDARLPTRPPRPKLPADQAIMPLCAAHAITISLTDRAADISLPSCTR